jgi:hypothetical protein
MRPRLMGKIALIVATLGLAVAAFVQAVSVNEHKVYRGYRAISFAILAVAGATSVRYFED